MGKKTHIIDWKKKAKDGNYPTLCGRYTSIHMTPNEREQPTCVICKGLQENKLNIDISEDEITVSLLSGIEVVHWVRDEWEEDPTILPAIANAIHLAHTAPDHLMSINIKHINSQVEVLNGSVRF